jgi:lipopolysaccharide heptosyltransferase II
MLPLQAPAASRVVIIDWSMIGDLVMLSPCMRALREHYPEAHIALLGQPVSISTFKHSQYIDELIPYDRSRGDYNVDAFRQPVRALRSERFDLGFLFHNSIGSALMAWLGRVRQRVGYRYEGRDLLLTRRLRLPERRQHLIETKADLLRACGIRVTDLTEEVPLDSTAAKSWLREKLGPNFGRTRPVVAVSIGATKDYKHWSAEGLNAFLNRFPVNTVDFIFTGAPTERSLYEGVYSYNNTVVDLVGQTTVEELTWVLDRADLFVGPDSGPMHLAIGRRTPVVALYGPTDPAHCGPYQYEQSVVIRADRICSRCAVAYGRQMSLCLHTIDPDETYYAAVGLLAQRCKDWNLDNV